MLPCSLNVFVVVVLVGRMVFSCPSSPRRHPHYVPPTYPPTHTTPLPVLPVKGGIRRLPQGANTTLPCDVNITIPVPVRWYRVRWYKDGVCKTDHVFENVTKKPHEFPGLPIISVSFEDRGAYICSASTDHEAEDATTINLVVGECEGGTFGIRCEYKCGFCADGETCQAITGRCHKCKTGWILPRCRSRDPNSCEKGTYGPTCEGLCGYCAGNVTCNTTNGNCKKGCQEGWNPPLCQVRKGNAKGTESLALSVSVGAPAILGVIAAVLQLFKWMSDGMPCQSGFGDEDEEDEQDRKHILQNAIRKHLLVMHAAGRLAQGGNDEEIEEVDEEAESDEKLGEEEGDVKPDHDEDERKGSDLSPVSEKGSNVSFDQEPAFNEDLDEVSNEI